MNPSKPSMSYACHNNFSSITAALLVICSYSNMLFLLPSLLLLFPTFFLYPLLPRKKELTLMIAMLRMIHLVLLSLSFKAKVGLVCAQPTSNHSIAFHKHRPHISVSRINATARLRDTSNYLCSSPELEPRYDFRYAPLHHFSFLLYTVASSLSYINVFVVRTFTSASSPATTSCY